MHTFKMAAIRNREYHISAQVSTILSCNTTLYMFSGVINPFLNVYFTFEVIFKAKSHFHSNRLVRTGIYNSLYVFCILMDPTQFNRVHSVFNKDYLLI